jgi:hypothetical protein
VTFGYAAFDLDGTLLGEDGTVDPVTLDGLRRLRERGLSLLVATGRSPYRLQQLGLSAEVLDLFEPLMLLRDGDVQWNWRTDAIESMRTVPDTAVPALLAWGFPDIVVDTGRGIVSTSESAADRYARLYRCPRSSIVVSGRLPHAPVLKVTVFGERRDVLAALTGIDGCSVGPRKSGRCNVVPLGSCKTAGLARLMAERYAEPTLGRVVAFGDGDNDVCLLGSVGAGVAMADSYPGAARAASLRLRGTLAGYLTAGFPRGLEKIRRAGRRCRHAT